MQRVIMKSRVHRATGKRLALDFEATCSIAPESMRATGVVPREIVRVVATNHVAERAAIA